MMKSTSNYLYGVCVKLCFNVFSLLRTAVDYRCWQVFDNVIVWIVFLIAMIITTFVVVVKFLFFRVDQSVNDSAPVNGMKHYDRHNIEN